MLYYSNVYKKNGSKVPGAVWEITEEHEKKLTCILNIYNESKIVQDQQL